jgi:thioredoxin-like negative regulator of GroEL
LPLSLLLGMGLHEIRPGTARGFLVDEWTTSILKPWTAWTLSLQADRALMSENPEQAAALFREAADIQPGSIDYPFRYIMVLVELGRCDEAEAVMKQMQARWEPPEGQGPRPTAIDAAAQVIQRCRQQKEQRAEDAADGGR